MDEKQRRVLVVAGAVALALVAFLAVWALSGRDGDDEPAPASTTSTTAAVDPSTTTTSDPSASTTTVDVASSTTVPPTGAPVPTPTSTTAPPDTASTTTAPDATAAENAQLVSQCLAGDVDACFEVGARQLPPPGDFGGSKYASAADAVVEEACFDNKVAAACYVAGLRGLPLVMG